MLSNKIIQYAVRKHESNEVNILFKSYFPMSEEEVFVSLFYEGYVRESNEFIAEKITEDNYNKFTNLNNCIIVSNLNDKADV